jgi:hypothetical protein
MLLRVLPRCLSHGARRVQYARVQSQHGRVICLHFGHAA